MPSNNTLARRCFFLSVGCGGLLLLLLEAYYWMRKLAVVVRQKNQTRLEKGIWHCETHFTSSEWKSTLWNLPSTFIVFDGSLFLCTEAWFRFELFVFKDIARFFRSCRFFFRSADVEDNIRKILLSIASARRTTDSLYWIYDEIYMHAWMCYKRKRTSVFSLIEGKVWLPVFPSMVDEVLFRI